jgi:hypothetical protein
MNELKQLFIPVAINWNTSNSNENSASKLMREIYIEKERAKILSKELELERKKCKELESYISIILMVGSGNKFADSRSRAPVFPCQIFGSQERTVETPHERKLTPKKPLKVWSSNNV